MDGTILDSMFIWEEAGERMLRDRGLIPKPGLINAMLHMSMEEGAAYVKETYHLQETVEEILDKILEIIQKNPRISRKEMGQSLFLWDLTHDPTKIYTGRHPCLNPEGMLGSI